MKRLVIALILMATLIPGSLITNTLAQTSSQNYFFELHYTVTQDNSGPTAELLVQQLAQIGIKLTVDIADGTTLWTRVFKGAADGSTFTQGGYDMTAFGWSLDTSVADPSGLTSMFSSSARYPVGLNLMNWANGNIDKLFATGDAMIDRKAAEVYYQNASAIIYDQVPVSIVYAGPGVNLFSKNIIFTDPFTPGTKTGNPIPTDKYGSPSLWSGDWYYYALRFLARSDKTYEDDTSFTTTVLSDLAQLNPVLAGFSSSNAEVHYAMYDALIMQPNSLKALGDNKGDLATGWTTSSDGLKVTFNLRTDVKWHDGVPFTSADVLCTYNAYLKSDIGYGCSVMQDYIKNVEAPDNYTVVFNLNKPILDFGFIFYAPIIPDHIWGKIPYSDWRTSDYNTGVKLPPGTGPYMLVKWVKGDYVQLDRYPGYAQGTVFFDHYFYKVFANAEAQRVAIQSGEADYRKGNYVDVDFAKANPNNVKAVISPVDGPSMVIVYNTANPLLNNVWVRRAINYAIPRDHIMTDILKGVAGPLNQMVGKGSPGYNPRIPPYVYSIDLAKQSMEAAGYNYDWLVPAPETPIWMFVAPAIAGVIIGAAVIGLYMKRGGQKAPTEVKTKTEA